MEIYAIHRMITPSKFPLHRPNETFGEVVQMGLDGIHTEVLGAKGELKGIRSELRELMGIRSVLRDGITCYSISN